MFVIKNKELFQINTDYHSFNTRNKNDLHLHTINLKLSQKGIAFSGAKVFNHLPLELKKLAHDAKRFKSALQTFLFTNSFYSIEEYLNYKLHCNDY